MVPSGHPPRHRPSGCGARGGVYLPQDTQFVPAPTPTKHTLLSEQPPSPKTHQTTLVKAVPLPTRSVPSVLFDSLRPSGLEPAKLLCPWDSSGKSTGVGCHFLLQGVFPTQGLNPGLLHSRQPLMAESEEELKRLLRRVKNLA